MKKEKVVYSWKLSEGDIEGVCEKNDIDYKGLTKEDKRNIIYYFGKGFEVLVDAWESVLEDAIFEIKEKL